MNYEICKQGQKSKGNENYISWIRGGMLLRPGYWMTIVYGEFLITLFFHLYFRLYVPLTIRISSGKTSTLQSTVTLGHSRYNQDTKKLTISED